MYRKNNNGNFYEINNSNNDGNNSRKLNYNNYKSGTGSGISKRGKMFIIGLSAITFFSFMSFLKNDPGDYEKQKNDSCNNTVSYNIDDMSNDELKNYFYNNPKKANDIVSIGLDSLIDNSSLNSETGNKIFYLVHDWIEKKPELTQYLGANSKSYMAKKLAGDYVNIVGDSIKSGFESIGNYGVKIKESLDEILK
jgi:hypothetical protein